MKHATHGATNVPVSVHLERQREFLERRGVERGIAGDSVDAPDPSPLDAHGGRAAALPFERRDDED